MIRYQESNIKVIFHNISYNFLLIFQVKQSHPVGFFEHINLDYIYLLETSTYKVYVSSCMGGWPQGPWTSQDFYPREVWMCGVCPVIWIRQGRWWGAPSEEIPHRLLWLSQQQKLPWEWSVWYPLLVALIKVEGGGWAGEDPETSLRRRAEPVVVCGPLGLGVSFRFLPCSYQLLKAPELLRDQSANLTWFVH